MIEISQTHTSIPLQVRLETCILLLLLTLAPLGPSESEIRRRLTSEEEQDEFISAPIDPSGNSTGTGYIIDGLDLEGYQYVFPGLPFYLHG